MSGTLATDVRPGTRPVRRWRLRMRRLRAWVEWHPRIRIAYRVAVGLIGFLIVVIGLILVPLPGPGWLVVFLGIAVLGTEFPAAHRASAFVRRVASRVAVRTAAWWRSRRMSRSV